MKTLQILKKTSVILSGGESVTFFTSRMPLEPKSKDLAEIGRALEKRRKTLLRLKHLPLTASMEGPDRPRPKEKFRQSPTVSSVRARSFDFGSVSVGGKTTSIGSPSLRMTEFFLLVPTTGATP